MYEFKQQDAFEFARRRNIEAKPKNGELTFRTCPYCNSQKDRDTFSINLSTGQFKCLRASCGAHGNMITLSKDFDFSLGTDVDEYYRPKKQYRKLPQVVPEPKPEAVKYMESRGIPQEITEQYCLTVQKDHPNVLVFPFYDDKGRLQFIKYRKTDFDKEKDKNKEWSEKNCKPILFGMWQCKNFERLILTEGQIDSLSVAAAGVENAVSVPTGAKGFTWVPYCWDWVNKFREIVVFGDHEGGKITLLEEISMRFKCRIRHIREQDYRDCKDANEILQKYGKDYLKKCVENAVLLPIKQVIDLADVPNVDPFAIPKLPIGISEADRLLYGGLPPGVTIIAGSTGEGKSTVASQILVNALSKKLNCFAYSGELPNYMFKMWLDYQIAGPKKMFEYSTKWGDRYYTLSETNRKIIAEWYRGRCFLYDNSFTSAPSETKDLTKLTEDVIMQYGVKVVLLDNLMTAMSLDAVRGSDKYERQSAFVNRLAKIAAKYNAWILLVAHKRKDSYSSEVNDSVSGSADITNLASIVLSYERNKDIDPSQRLLKVSKNRVYGKINTKGYILNYDERSKRIYGFGDDVNFNFGWDKSNEEETPFD